MMYVVLAFDMCCWAEWKCSPKRMRGVDCVDRDEDQSGLLSLRAHNSGSHHAKSFGR